MFIVFNNQLWPLVPRSVYTSVMMHPGNDSATVHEALSDYCIHQSAFYRP